MKRQALSRRDLVRTGSALTATAALGSLSGCLGLFDSNDDEELGLVEHVPFGTTYAVHADVASVLDDEQLRAGLDEALPTDVEPYADAESVTELLDRAEDDAGLDVRAVSETLSFGGLALDDAATIVWADWDIADVTATLGEQVELEEETHRDRTVYATDNAWTCELESGVFVTGAPSTTRAAIDLWAGAGQGASDRLTDAYRASLPGHIRYGFGVPPEIAAGVPGATVNEPLVEDIDYGYGAIYADGTERVAELNFQAADSSTAETLENALFTVVTLLGQEGGEIELPTAIESILEAGIEDVEVDRDGEIVSVTYRNEPADLGPLLVELVGELWTILDVGTP